MTKVNHDKKKELLELIAEKMGTGYLSDLRHTTQLYDCYQAVSQIEADSYTAKEWWSAISYILEVKRSGDTPEGAKTWFLDRLQVLSGLKK